VLGFWYMSRALLAISEASKNHGDGRYKGLRCSYLQSPRVLPPPPARGIGSKQQQQRPACLGGEVVKNEVAVLVVLIRRHCRDVGAAVRIGSSSGSCHSWCRCWWRGPSIILPFSLHRT